MLFFERSSGDYEKRHTIHPNPIFNNPPNTNGQRAHPLVPTTKEHPWAWWAPPL